MKSIKNINWIVLLFVAVWFSSCKKALDLEPTHTQDGGSYFTSIDDYEKALAGAYSKLLQDAVFGTSNTGANSLVALPDIMSDNLFETSESLANFQDYSRWTYTADDPSIADMWLDQYGIIQQCNLTIRGIDKFSAKHPGAVNRIKAQAIALRAMTHFNLLRFFGEEVDRNSTARGIPYVDKFDVEQKPARLTIKQSYDKIEADLLLAKDLMQDMDQPIETDGIGAADRSYIDEMVINAILARMYLTANSLEDAAEYASMVIDVRPLASREKFPNIWIDASTEEVIWSVKFESFNSDIGSVMYFSVGNRAAYRATTDLVTKYDQTKDIRFSSYFRQILPGANRDDDTRPSRLVMIKYDAKQSAIPKPDGISNFKAFRTGEMYLIRAEANARLGAAKEVDALADLNDLREARISGYIPVVLSGSNLIGEIALERRKELVGEGHRFLDLKRTTKTINRVTNCRDFCRLSSSAREWALPIPQAEFLANKKIEQNENY